MIFLLDIILLKLFVISDDVQIIAYDLIIYKIINEIKYDETVIIEEEKKIILVIIGFIIIVFTLVLFVKLLWNKKK